MNDKIEDTIAYYTKKGEEILKLVNSRNDLVADEIIEYGNEMAIIEYKLTALQNAMEL